MMGQSLHRTSFPPRMSLLHFHVRRIQSSATPQSTAPRSSCMGDNGIQSSCPRPIAAAVTIGTKSGPLQPPKTTVERSGTSRSSISTQIASLLGPLCGTAGHTNSLPRNHYLILACTTLPHQFYHLPNILIKCQRLQRIRIRVPYTATMSRMQRMRKMRLITRGPIQL